MGTIKDRNGMDLTEAEGRRGGVVGGFRMGNTYTRGWFMSVFGMTTKNHYKKKGGNNTQKNYTKKDLHDPDNHDGVMTHLEPDILEWEDKWALGNTATNKASGGDGILAELFQILKDDAVKVLHSVCQQIWKTQQWP